MNTIKACLIVGLAIISNLSSAQNCSGDDRFTEIDFFTDTQINSAKNLTYGNAVDWQDNQVDLKLDIYYPDTSFDTLTGRPFIMLIHGGGFQSGNRTSLADECKEFAKRGFVAATISYRLGHNPANPNEVFKAVYRAQQDADAALRYIISEAGNYKIDTSWIFIGGGSAGSITAFNTNYITQSEWNEFYPGIETILGALHTSGNGLNHSFSLKGIFNNWGSTFGTYIDIEEMIPMVSFHGEDDQIVPVDTSEIGLFGSRAIHNLLQNNNVCSDLTVKPNAGHGVYKTSEGSLFRIGRASCFFKSLFCDDCTSFYTTDSIPANCSEQSGNLQFDITLRTGWNGISSYLEPTNQSLASIVEQLGDSFACLQNLDGIYYPEGAMTTIENWELQSGYQIKVNQDTLLRIDGAIPDSFSLHFNEGWNLMPVLSSTPVNIDNLFNEHLSKIEIIKESVGTKIFWPEMDIIQISQLIPTQSYYIKSGDTLTISF